MAKTEFQTTDPPKQLWRQVLDKLWDDLMREYASSKVPKVPDDIQ